ncbi:type I restriction enzyme HsdR N-terminal domain-containing protein [Desulfobotulus sp. H1]|uniref:Type I restriction enzyme HsdR N-terminal domain-containing protein n=1 Tax=Desulfobotulus pelophilus TaxID=2823377 RepID=A0ABT3N869_9BACT|nr:type I restriction endonuclease [Desulfobotulus pelophilus]MCW7753651.1 type I restriction enzyme HsdR N-terminal domain-containing protein [Desulfobotulus pelophilus]
MDLIDKIKDIASRIPKQIEHIQTEEATKNAFVMPFINALGYDVFNPLEVLPEFTSDVGTKKGEKVDYAIKKDNKIIMLIECKWRGCDLDKEHVSQLYRYFSVTESRFGIVTNGLIYRFYSDIEEKNKMDMKPFFEFNILNFEDHQIEELKKFTKPSFDLDYILTTASALKYTGSIKRIFAEELANPSDEFVRFFTAQVYSGVKTQAVVGQFTKIVKDALNQFIRERINDRLKSALNDVQDQRSDENVKDSQEPEVPEDGIVTTEEEIEGFHVVKAIVRDVIDVNRVVMRDTKSYCGILLDDNNRKPICRLHFNSLSKKYIGIFKQKIETRHFVNEISEIYNFADQIKLTIAEYTGAEINKKEAAAVEEKEA